MDCPHVILIPRTTVSEPTHHNGRILFLGIKNTDPVISRTITEL